MNGKITTTKTQSFLIFLKNNFECLSVSPRFFFTVNMQEATSMVFRITYIPTVEPSVLLSIVLGDHCAFSVAPLCLLVPL